MIIQYQPEWNQAHPNCCFSVEIKFESEIMRQDSSVEYRYFIKGSSRVTSKDDVLDSMAFEGMVSVSDPSKVYAECIEFAKNNGIPVSNSFVKSSLINSRQQYEAIDSPAELPPIALPISSWQSEFFSDDQLDYARVMVYSPNSVRGPLKLLGAVSVSYSSRTGAVFLDSCESGALKFLNRASPSLKDTFENAVLVASSNLLKNILAGARFGKVFSTWLVFEDANGAPVTALSSINVKKDSNPWAPWDSVADFISDAHYYFTLNSKGVYGESMTIMIPDRISPNGALSIFECSAYFTDGIIVMVRPLSSRSGFSSAVVAGDLVLPQVPSKALPISWSNSI